MIRDICKDEAFLAQKAQPATPDDLSVGQDLLDTLAHHKEECVGMAANMIGVNKRIIVFDNKGVYQVMYNPEIVKKSGPTRRRRAACPSPAPGPPSGGSPSRCGGRMNVSRSGSRSSPAGRPKSSSTSSTTVRGL